MSRHRASAAAASGNALRRRVVWIPAVLCSLLTVAAVWLVVPANGGTQGAEGADSTAVDPSRMSALGATSPSTTWLPTTPDPEVARPGGESDPAAEQRTAVRVSIPSIEVDTSLVQLGVDPDTGGLIPPTRYDVAGVFAQGAVPGDPGPAVIAGHVDSQTGPGVFYHLEEIEIGAIISVSLSDGQQILFRSVEVAQYPKTAFPTAEVYGPTPGRELRLITCGGSFDRSRLSYRENIVVYAVRV